MIIQDVMMGYNAELNTYYVYSAGKQVAINGDMDSYRAILLFERAVEKVKEGKK